MDTDEKNYKLTDQGNAERFCREHGNIAKFKHATGKWVIWNGKQWIDDPGGEVDRLAIRTLKGLYEEARDASTIDESRGISTWANNSLNASRIRSMLNLAKAQTVIMAEELDINPMLFNVQNGNIDLETGELLPHNSENRLTKISPAIYDPEATCPTWLSFLSTIMGGDEGMVTYLQKAVGYSLTGSTKEQCMFILFGSGANGKTTFLNVVLHLLGNYGAQTPTESLMVRRNESVRSDIARLHGKRFVAASEGERNHVLAESLIKQLTGGDKITTRFMYQEYFEFTPEFKVFLATNYKPEIKGDDHGIWRRLRLIPFSVRIPEGQRDLDLLKKLHGELSGILNWAVSGCLLWRKEGLVSPDAVIAALAKYKSEMDIVSEFIEARCVLTPGERTMKSVLYGCYRSFCVDSGINPLGIKKFGDALKERGFKDHAFAKGSFWMDLKLAH